MGSWIFTQLVELQRQIYSQIGSYIQAFASGDGWGSLIAVLPMGIVFGVVHAMTPGHSKAVLATYVAGSTHGVVRALVTSIALSITHVSTALLIGALSLPLVSIALGSVGRAPALEFTSRALLALVGLWMLWRAVRRGRHVTHEGELVGFFAGLIPCPLTLFVMYLAMARGVPEAGLVFAAAMMIGIALTLSAVALLSVLLRDSLQSFVESRDSHFNCAQRAIEGLAGAILVLIAFSELYTR